MSIRQSLLALLSEQPRYGYELKSEFERRTGQSWPLNIGQVYSTLDRLERDGLVVRGSEDEQGRIRYEITPEGNDEVAQWWSQPSDDATPPRDELAIKLAIAVSVPDVDVARIIQVQRSASMRRLQTYLHARSKAGDDLAWRLVAQRLVVDAEAELRWLDDCEEEVMRAARQSVSSTKAEASSTAKQKARQ